MVVPDRFGSARRPVAVAVLVITTILWGTTFVITKTVTTSMPVMFYITLRFTMAASFFLPFINRSRKVEKDVMKHAFVAATIYFLSIVSQTFGLQFTTASKAGFLTGLNVILVPVFLVLFFKKGASKKLWISVIFALTGTYVLSFSGIEPLSLGDPLVIACAILYAFYIIYIDLKCKTHDIYAFNQFQLLFISLFSLGSSLLADDWQNTFQNLHSTFNPLFLVFILLYMGLCATSLTFIFQVYGQRYVAPTPAAIIFALEPIFATLFGIAWGGEQLSLQLAIGASLILVGVILSINTNANKKGNHDEKTKN